MVLFMEQRRGWSDLEKFDEEINEAEQASGRPPTMPVKACPHNGHGYYQGTRCPTCQATRYRVRPKTAARGLGADHRSRRELLRRAQPTGPCWLCGQPGDSVPIQTIR